MNTRLRLIKICLLTWALTGPGLFAQYKPAFYEQIKKEYPGENYVQLHNKNKYTLEVVDGGIEIIVESYSKYIYLKETHGMPISKPVYSSSFLELLEFEANSYIFENGKYKKVKIKDYVDKTSSGSDNFHDDINEIQISYSGISSGSIIELNTKHKLLEPRLLQSLYLAWYYPVRDFEVEIEYNNNIDLDLIKVNFDESMPDFAHEQTKSKNVYRFNNQNTHKYDYEPHAPDDRYFIPHVIPVIRSLKTAEGETDYLKDPKSLYAWYYTFIQNIDKDMDTADLKALADSLTLGCKSEIEKVKKLYNWVQNNIKYIAFEYGYDGYIPRKADVVYNNHYGDCKDKTSILHTLLKLSGIKSYFTWIGTTDLPYTYAEVPTPSTDNHMILTYVNQGRYYFLDGTGKFYDMAYPSAFTQGKEALIAKTKDDFELRKVPIMEPAKNLYKDSVCLEFSNGKLLGQGVVTLTGYQMMSFQYRLFEEGEKEQKEIIESKTEKGNNKYILLEHGQPRVNPDKPLMDLEYGFELENYYKQVGSDIYINLNLKKDILAHKLKKTRETPLKFRFCGKYEFIYKVTIPQGYSIGFLPENHEHKSQNYSYSIQYQVGNGEITYFHQFQINDLLVENHEFEEWSAFIQNLERNYKQNIVLKKDDE